MTKQELIAKAAAETKGYGRPLTQADMETALHTLCNVASAELLDGGEISLPGLGKLKIKEVPARQGRNPRTGEAMCLARFFSHKGRARAIQNHTSSFPSRVGVQGPQKCSQALNISHLRGLFLHPRIPSAIFWQRTTISTRRLRCQPFAMKRPLNSFTPMLPNGREDTSTIQTTPAASPCTASA